MHLNQQQLNMCMCPEAVQSPGTNPFAEAVAAATTPTANATATVEAGQARQWNKDARGRPPSGSERAPVRVWLLLGVCA
jgi:hypothetical protein